MKYLTLIFVFLIASCSTPFPTGARVELTNGKKELGCVVEQRSFWLNLYAVRLDDGRLVKAWIYDMYEIEGDCA